MINDIVEFNNEYFGKLTILKQGSEFFFIGKEVAKMLGYSNPSKALIDHVETEDKLNNKTLLSLGQRGGWVINESGLYSLILSSKLKKAKEFKRWVTREVLPSIRKNGGYILNQENLSNEELLANAMIVADNVIKEKDKKISELLPKAKYYDERVDKNLLVNLRNTAKELGVTQKMFINFLLDRNLLYRDKKGRLLPYSHTNKGYFEIKEWKSDTNNKVLGIQTLVTPKGRKYLMMLLKEVD